MNKNLYIIAGCNGAGKTTASLTILPEVLHCREFINADEIAKGLSPLNPDSVAIQAGKLMLQRFQYLLKSGETFAVETTLATKTYIKKIKQAQAKGYTITLLFFSLDSPELAIERVKYRVQEGGHNIPTDTIKRRYAMGLRYLFNAYLPIVDKAYVYDNSFDEPLLLMRQHFDKQIEVYHKDKCQESMNYADKQHTTDRKNSDKQAEALNQGLKKAYHNMLLFKKYKGTPVVVSENGKIKHLSADELLTELQTNH